MKAFEYITPESYDAATAFLAKNKDGGTLVKSGGIDLLDRLKERIDTPARVVNLRRLYEPKGSIERREKDKSLAIHALTTLADVAANSDVRKLFPALADACGHAATPQVRNVATIGGNLCQKPRCWYLRSLDFHCLKKGGDTCYAVEGDNRFHAIFGAGACHIVHPSNAAVPLLAYGASVRVIQSEGGRTTERIVPLDEFFRVPANPQDNENILEPGEIVREVLIPLAAGGAKSGYVELREKQSFDWPLVTCAVNLNDAKNPRVVLGAVAPIPWRLRNVESLLSGGDVNAALVKKAASVSTEGAKPMTQNGYKMQQVPEVVSQALRQAAKLA